MCPPLRNTPPPGKETAANGLDRSIRGEIAKRKSLSILNGDYAPYRAWAGIDPEAGKVKTAQVNNFSELFD
jgi:hypothetical protein